MTIDSIYSKERGHRLSPLYTDRHYSFKCYQFAVQFKRQPHYFLPRSPPFSLFSSARRRGGHFYWPGPVANRFCNHAIREREDRCCEMRKKRCARSLRKIRMFLGLVDHSHWSGEWNSNSSASSFHLRVHQFRWPDNITRRFWWIKYGFEMEANNMVGSS